MSVIGANPVKTKRKAKPKAKRPAKRKAAPKRKAPKAKAKTAPKRKPAAAKKRAPAKRKAAPRKAPRKARKAPRKRVAAKSVARVVEETLRETPASGYGAKTDTRKSAKPRTQKAKDATMKKGKKSGGKRKAPKRKAAKRKSGESKAKRSAAAKKGARREGSRKRKAAARKAAETRAANAASKPAPARKAPKKPRKKAARKSSAGGSGPGQFAPGRPNTHIEVRRAPDGHFSRLRSMPATKHGPGEVEAIAIHRNPIDTGMFIATAAVGGGAGFGLASLAGRLYVTSAFALKREKDSAGNPLYTVDDQGKVTHADGTPVTGTDYAAMVNAHSWIRDGISFGVAALSLAGGMYFFKPGGVARTGALWIGVGSAVEGGSQLIGKLVLPWMLRKNQTFATRLAPQETTTYLLQHPDAQADQPVFAGADNAALGGATGKDLGCVGGDTCGCNSCCAKRSQSLQACIQKYATEQAPGRTPPRTMVTATPNPDILPQQPQPQAPPANSVAMPMGGAPANIRSLSTREKAHARRSA